jgi:hypothetical protein
MIPVTDNDFLEEEFEEVEEPSKTFNIMSGNKSIGFIDELESLKQTIFLILNTERYDYEIHEWEYGIETNDLFGQPTNYVISELKRRIPEALTQDTRILGVSAFSFEIKKGIVHATFTVSTIFGDATTERAVNI